jgi:ribosomal protein S14
VYQLQGGIDKYFKQFPDGGYWEGKNYTFDKRFAHAPAEKDAAPKEEKQKNIMGKCEACKKPWDMYRGKRRCPTCGVPSLICRECFQADKDCIRKLDRNVRCDLCEEENITSKAQVRQRDEQELREYEAKMAARGVTIEREPKGKQPRWHPPAPNPDGVTRLLLKNMCRKNMDEATLMEAIPGITHIVWRTDRKTGQFFGSGWVEMATPEDAAVAVGMSGKRVLGRPIYISYQAPDGKDAWPPASSKVV